MCVDTSDGTERCFHPFKIGNDLNKSCPRTPSQVKPYCKTGTIIYCVGQKVCLGFSTSCYGMNFLANTIICISLSGENMSLIPGLGRSPENEMATHSNILA
ncbi:unnamed protein product [Rangifer tarandus platyrhynchus]|uniref:Uncharacterized protein n=2 Tax=Rangifer tarandus platyrhynchus TaxID=3082113 RepID=A0AC59Y740_RANTA|nr:unnamed protein product [Rangifer tarandus platyrhynchus]